MWTLSPQGTCGKSITGMRSSIPSSEIVKDANELGLCVASYFSFAMKLCCK